MGGLSGAGVSSAGATEGGGSVAPGAGALGASKEIKGQAGGDGGRAPSKAADAQFMLTGAVEDEAAAREAW